MHFCCIVIGSQNFEDARLADIFKGLSDGLYRIDGTHASASTKPGLRIDSAAAGNQATDRPEDVKACPTLPPYTAHDACIYDMDALGSIDGDALPLL